jgi:hypothetical protein
VVRTEVEDEVRHRVNESSEERDPREAPFQQYRRRRQQHAESEVQRAHVPHEVLVVGTKSLPGNGKSS